MRETGVRHAMQRMADLYSRFLSVLLALCVFILIFPVALQVFARFTDFLPHYIWTEEMARFLLVWTVMIGAMVGLKEGIHFNVDLWPDMKGRPRAALDLVSGIFVLGFAAAFLWYGMEFVDFAWFRISELAELPLWLIHLAWPILGFSWLLFGGLKFYDDLKTLFGGEAP